MTRYRALLSGLALTLLVSALTLAPGDANAVPAFARQTGFACNTCHFQHFPTLNQFGRVFKAGGYTMVGGQSLVEGDFLSLPTTLNASVITKLMYQKSNGRVDLDDRRNRGMVQMPNEGALLIGGRAGEHVGFLLEAQLVDGEGSNWASFKMPVVYGVGNVQLSVTPFTTDAAGAAYGFELLNTGAMRMQRPLEHRRETSAQQYIGTATESTGAAFVAFSDIGYINYTAWSPEHQATDANPYLHYGRAALTRVVSGWDLAVGGQIWDGDTELTEDTTTLTACSGAGAPIPACTMAGEIVETTVTAFTRVAAEAWAVDAQAQGSVGGLPLGLYLAYAEAKRSDAAITNLFNSSTTDDKKAFTALLELGVIPSKLTVAASYRDAETGAATLNSEDALTLGASYLLTQNVQLQLDHTWYDNDVDPDWGDKLLTLMVFAAF